MEGGDQASSGRKMELRAKQQFASSYPRVRTGGTGLGFSAHFLSPVPLFGSAPRSPCTIVTPGEAVCIPPHQVLPVSSSPGDPFMQPDFHKAHNHLLMYLFAKPELWSCPQGLGLPLLRIWQDVEDLSHGYLPELLASEDN